MENLDNLGASVQSKLRSGESVDDVLIMLGRTITELATRLKSAEERIYELTNRS